MADEDDAEAKLRAEIKARLVARRNRPLPRIRFVGRDPEMRFGIFLSTRGRKESEAVAPLTMEILKRGKSTKGGWSDEQKALIGFPHGNYPFRVIERMDRVSWWRVRAYAWAFPALGMLFPKSILWRFVELKDAHLDADQIAEAEWKAEQRERNIIARQADTLVNVEQVDAQLKDLLAKTMDQLADDVEGMSPEAKPPKKPKKWSPPQ